MNKNIYHIVTPTGTKSFFTRQAAREYKRTWSPTDAIMLTSILTPKQSLWLGNVTN